MTIDKETILSRLEKLKDLYLEIKKKLEELKKELENKQDSDNKENNDTKEKADELSQKAKETAKKITETIRNLNEDLSEEAKSKIKSIQDTLKTETEKVNKLYRDIIESLWFSSWEKPTSLPTIFNKENPKNVLWRIKEQRNDLKSREKRKEQPWKNFRNFLLFWLWTWLTWYGVCKWIKKLWENIFWKKKKKWKNKEKKSFLKTAWRNILKWLWIWSATWWWIYYLSKILNENDNTDRDTNNPDNKYNVTTNHESNEWNDVLTNLTKKEQDEMDKLVKDSEKPNNIIYLKNPTYKKYLHIVERNLNLPKYSLECLCSKESFWWLLYRNWKILTSNAGAKWLFQFMDGTAGEFMQNQAFWKTLKDKYWKAFKNRDEFIKDPLATARAAGILLSKRFIGHYHLNFQSALACYNWWEGNYKKFTWRKNLDEKNFNNLRNETKDYVLEITKNILLKNSVINPNDKPNLNKILTTNLWELLWK